MRKPDKREVRLLACKQCKEPVPVGKDTVAVTCWRCVAYNLQAGRHDSPETLSDHDQNQENEI